MATSRQIMTIQEMIQEAFGHQDFNRVNFKLIEIILTLLGKQLNVLTRRVSIENPRISTAGLSNKSKLSVTEIKIHAAVKKKSKTKDLAAVSEHGYQRKKDISSRSSSREASQRSSSSSIKDTTSSSHSGPHGKSANAFDKSDDAVSGEVDASVDVERKSSVSEVFRSKKYFEDLLDKIEIQREKVLRVIHQVHDPWFPYIYFLSYRYPQQQRADSHDEGVLSPAVMASLEDTEMQYEKLLVVDRLTPEEAEAISRNQSHPRELAIVTKEEFLKIAQAVANLQTLFGKFEDSPENKQLLKDIHNKTLLTDPMSVVQISGRLDATEKAIKAMNEMLDVLPKKPVSKSVATGSTAAHQSAHERHAHGGHEMNQDRSKTGQSELELLSRKGVASRDDTQSESERQFSSKFGVGTVNIEQFNNSLAELYDDIQSAFGAVINRAQTNATTAMKIAKKSEEKVDEALKLGPEMRKVQTTVQHYAEQVNALDAGISSQLANYQEQLTQMEYDLESGLENMQDALALKGGDTEAMNELHSHFAGLQGEFENTKTYQKELEEHLSGMTLDLFKLRNEVELLRDTKCDRDEVVDALRDKAGLKDVNGLVDLTHFGSVFGNIESQIRMLHKQRFGQEMIWQKAIDELNSDLRRKADWVHVVTLRDDINAHLEMLRKRLHVMADILGEPNAAAVSRRLQRDSACLACAAPAVIDPKTKILPVLPALKVAVGPKQETKPKSDGGGDHDSICYCGQPISHHKKDSRSDVCKRYCGGDHTRGPFVRSRVPPELHVKPMQREASIAVGSDGKSYYIDEPQILEPCIPCNAKKDQVTVEPKEADVAPISCDPSKISYTPLLDSAWPSVCSQRVPEYEKIAHDDDILDPEKPSLESRGQSRRTTFHTSVDRPASSSNIETRIENPETFKNHSKLNSELLTGTEGEVAFIEEYDIDHEAILDALQREELLTSPTKTGDTPIIQEVNQESVPAPVYDGEVDIELDEARNPSNSGNAIEVENTVGPAHESKHDEEKALTAMGDKDQASVPNAEEGVNQEIM